MTGIAERPTVALDSHALTARQRASLRAQLSSDREQARLLIDSLNAEMDAFSASRWDTSTDDEHDPEGPTLAFERSQSSAMMQQSERHIEEIDAALLRMDEGTYGLCTNCGRAIAVGRLQARPQAEHCIHCAAKLR